MEDNETLNRDLFDYFWPENLTGYPVKESNLLSILWENGKWEIPLYSIIFLLAVVGNILVILTLVRNIRMRTNTNVFLLNLAVSDLVLAVLCMPFTLIGTLLRDFVFGESMCKLVPYLQATSVAASVWTLVALSIERYYGICHPFRSRRWQTLSHAYHLIGYIWAGGALTMLPICVLSELQPTNSGHHKCRESWPSRDYERLYNLILDLLLLLFPLLALGVTYYLIATTLWRDLAKRPDGSVSRRSSARRTGNGLERPSKLSADHGEVVLFLSETFDESSGSVKFRRKKSSGGKIFTRLKKSTKTETETVQTDLDYAKADENSSSNEVYGSLKRNRSSFKSIDSRPGLRHTNYERSLRKKQRVVKMLFVVVLEFFVCWTPLFVVNTLALFWPKLVYGGIGYKTISFCQLLAYTSGCCNPITYCFMSKGFRNSFINLFAFCRRRRGARRRRRK